MSDPTQDPARDPDQAPPPPAPAHAFAALLPDLARVARRLARSPEDADDLVQETLLRVWSRLAMARLGPSDAGAVDDLRAYAFATLRNCARTRAPGPRTGAVATDPEDAPDARAGPGPRLAAAATLRALAALPEEQRGLLRLRAIEGLSYAEIAARTGLPLGTVTSRLSRGRRALRQALGLRGAAALADLLPREAGEP